MSRWVPLLFSLYFATCMSADFVTAIQRDTCHVFIGHPNQIIANQLHLPKLYTHWKVSIKDYTSNLVIPSHIARLYPDNWPVVPGFPLPLENLASSYSSYLSKKSNKEIFWVEGNQLYSHPLGYGVSKLVHPFDGLEPLNTVQPFLSTGDYFENKWRSQLVGLTQGGILFGMEPFSKELLWQRSFEHLTDKAIGSLVHPTLIRLSSGLWCFVMGVNDVLFFIRPRDGQLIHSIELPKEFGSIHSICPVDTLNRGFVDKLYVQSSQRLACLQLNHPELTQWTLTDLVLPVEGKLLNQSPILTLGDSGDHIHLTQVISKTNGDSVYQFKDFILQSRFSRISLHWGYHSEGKILSIKSLSSVLLVQEEKNQKWFATVLDARTGQLLEQKRIHEIRMPISDTHEVDKLSKAEAIMLPRQPRSEENNVLFINPKFKIGWAVLKLDFESLGRSAWRPNASD